MAIRIERNEQGNCINFHGSSNPTYWNACLSGEVDPSVADTVNVVNDIITSQTGVKEYEFFQIPYTEFTDKDGNGFSTAQECADYITTNANVVGLGGGGTDLAGVDVCFKLDDTSTSVMLDNGYSFGVNTIKAIAESGNISIKSELGDITHFTGLEYTRVCDGDGNFISGGLNDVVNYLNELFTVGAFEAIVITDPEATTIADVGGTLAGYTLEGSTSIDPVGDDIFTNSGSGNYAGLKSTATIDQAGEYFTFDIRNEGQIGFGLIHTQASYDAGYYSGSSVYADPTSFAVGNSAHYGFQFSHWFHPTPNGSWTNYGANTAYSQREGWYAASTHFEAQDEWLAGEPIKIKVGIDANGFIEIASLKDDGVTWAVHARTSYPVTEGAEFHLGVKSANSTPRVATAPKVHLLPEVAPTMYFRYIESPDGVFHYPVFATADEADYYDENHNGVTGSGTHSTIVFPDDPTLSTWYIPTTGYENNGSEAPTGETFIGNAVNYNEINSLTNQDLAPAAFDIPDYTVNELSSVNIQVAPQDSSFTTTVTGLPSGLGQAFHTIEGTAPEVTGDNVSNPSDTYTITVTRTNSYGSATDSFVLTVNNLTAPVTAISGFNHLSGTTAMIDSDTMDNGSVVHVNNTVADGERFVIEASYVETNILPSLQASGDQYIIGLENAASDFSTLEVSDFDAAIVWEYESASSHTFKFYRDGGLVQNIVIGSLTQAFYDYAIEADGTSAWLIACNINSIMNEPSPSEGGVFSHTYEVTNTEDTAPLQIHMATLNTSGDISTTGIETITTPAPTVGILTSWSKALDFSGSSERAQMVSSSNAVNPMMMGGTNNQVSAPTTSGNTVASGHPWATAIVFKSDKNSSNQHIWNLGEGAGSTDDNIYLRTDATGKLHFGWGRDGDLCEMLIHPYATGTGWTLTANNWYGIYIAHNGTRYGSNNTTSLMADSFDIRLMGSSNNWATVGGSDTNLSAAGDWSINGDGRMNRQYQGDLTIGGRGANRNFHGKVASFVTTTLKCGVAMPDTTEIEMMITDPTRWLQDYKEGNTFRQSLHTTTNTDWDTSVGTTKAFATQVWLMGDGVSDSYSNMIRNQVFPSDQNYTKMNMISMVSSDIVNVTISGLS